MVNSIDSSMNLPGHIWCVVFDYLDALSLITYHSTSQFTRRCLPRKLPHVELAELSKLRGEVIQYMSDKRLQPDYYIQSNSHTLHGVSDAERLLSCISYTREHLLSYAIAVPDWFTRAWAPTINVIRQPPSRRLPVFSKRWYHSQVQTDLYSLRHKRQIKSEPFTSPLYNVVQERKAPPPVIEELDKMTVFNRVKWYCGKSFSTKSPRFYTGSPPRYVYEVLTEPELMKHFEKGGTGFGDRVPFSNWYQDGDWWRILLVSVRTGNKSQYITGRPDFEVRIGSFCVCSV